MEEQRESISSRLIKLNQLFFEKLKGNVTYRHIISRDGLMDALFALYDECNNEYMRKDKHIAAFVDKFRNAVIELRQLQVNIGDFETKKIIGQGHFGEVQVVRERCTGDVYAMKILRKSDTLSQQSVAFYEEERDIMAKSSSPWITKLHYAFQDRLHLYLVMEFHPGGDMLSFLDHNNDQLSEDIARFYLAELVLAIQSVHNMGYVHRDIKPDNILIDRTGHIKLADFGSAAKLGAQKTVLSKMPVGTPDYIAPEVLMAMNSGPAASSTYGVECDWWSLGIVAYEMLFGHTPFADEKVLATYNNIMNFKKSLKFPNDVEVSQSAVDLIKGLLQESTERWGYEQLYVNIFFIDIDWDNIRQIPPPFVPKVSAEDDTSNFDDFEHETARPSASDLKSKKEFSGKNLPFIGFTYSCCNTVTERISMSMDNSIALLNVTSGDENKKESQKITLLEENEILLRKQIEELQECLKEREKKIKSAQEEQNAEQNKIVQLESEVSSLRRIIETERKDRTVTEEKALEIMKNIKDNFKKRENDVTIELKKCIDSKKQEITYLKEKLQSTQVDYEKKKKQLEKINEELKESKNLLLEYQERVNKMENEKAEMQIGMENYKKALAKSHNDMQMIREENIIAQEQIDGLKNAMFKLESELRKMEIKKLLSEKNNNKLEQKDSEENIKILNIEEENKNKDNEIILLKKQLEDISSSKEKLLDEFRALDSALQEEKCSKEESNEQFNIKVEELQSKLQNSEKEIQELKAFNDKYKKDIHNLQEKEFEFVNTVSELKSKISKVETHVEELKKENSNLKTQQVVNKEGGELRKSLDKLSVLQQENAYLTTKVGQLETHLERVRENLGKQRIKADDLQQQLKKKESEISEIKIDLRIAQREAKQAEDIVGSLQSSNRNLREKANNLEKYKSEEDNKQKQLMEDIANLKQELEEKNKELENINKLFEKTKDFEEKYNNIFNACEKLNKRVEALQDEVLQKDEEKQQLTKEVNGLRNKLTDKIHENEVLELNMNTLKTICTELEDQIHVLERLLETHQENESKLMKQKDSCQNDIEKLEDDVRTTQEILAKEKRNRIEKELLLEEIQDEQQSQCAIYEAELKTLREQNNQQREINKDLGNQIVELEKELSLVETTRDTMQKKLYLLEEENVQIKEEAARHITQISSFKMSNLKLTQELEETVSKLEETRELYEQICSELESNQVSYENEKMKFEQTISQQTKLIDFLQTKAEGMEKKRKGMHKLFGNRKENLPLIPLQYRELEAMLEKERSKCRRLQEQLNKARSEILECRTEFNRNQSSLGLNGTFTIPTSPSSRAVLSVLTHSPGGDDVINNMESPLMVTKEVANTIKKPQGERMRHNIPHRFQDWLCMHGRKCVACLDIIHFGRHASKCQECEIVCHPKCASSLPNTCGIPPGYVEHFTHSLQKKDKANYLKAMKTMDSDESLSSDTNKIEGWIKVPRDGKQGWERHYACLEGTKIYIFDKGDNEGASLSSTTKEIELCPSNGEITIKSAVSATELITTAKSDLPYVLKVEFTPHTTCWPKQSHYIMTLSFPDKQLWVSALEAIVQSNKDETDSVQSQLLDFCILKQTNEMWEINTICALSEQEALLGAKEGLYVIDLLDLSMKSVKYKLENFHHVYQISVINQLNLIIVISGEERELWMFDLKELEENMENGRLDEPLNQRPILNLSGCHLFSTSEDFVCAATEKTVYLMKWNYQMEFFQKLKNWSFPETCSCMLFTKNSVILGADKFYEIDLKDYSLEEFLDPTDTSLAFLIYGALQLNSFPVAIFNVNPSGKPEEYLLCFHELGVFVDSYGRRTREDEIKWTKLPFAFSFQKPYLFITHFNAVEVIKISSEDEKMLQTSFPIHNPQYLGKATNFSIYISTKSDKEQLVLRLKGNFASEIITQEEVHPIRRISETESLGTEFSFTPSLLQSLEGPSIENTLDCSDITDITADSKVTSV
ncbi:citron Rho-interacting kinase-like isoform X3 [Centruroides vittatus]|uniref:citron Rho-interacting kinase-like isoform X3 n=1 Tax=Centruroides vittatus TaxID=120091 RepID=UPI003510C56B